jgi:hypothetical protein
MQTTPGEFTTLQNLLERIAFALESLAKASDPNFKTWSDIEREKEIAKKRGQ